MHLLGLRPDVATTRPVPGLIATRASGPQSTCGSGWMAVGPMIGDALREISGTPVTSRTGSTPDLRVWNVAGGAFRFRYDDGVRVHRRSRGHRSLGQVAGFFDARGCRDLPPGSGPGLRSAASRRRVPSRERRRRRRSRGPDRGPAGGRQVHGGGGLLSDGPRDPERRRRADRRSGTACWHVQPAYPQLRLWPDSVAAALRIRRRASAIDANLGQTRAGSDEPTGGGFQAAATAARGHLRLRRATVDDRGHTRSLSGRESLLALVANSYMGYLLDPAMRAPGACVSCTRSAASVPIRRLVPPADAARPRPAV